MKGKGMEAIKGNSNKKENICSFCREPRSTCKGVNRYTTKNELGVHLKAGKKGNDVNEIALLHNYIEAIKNCGRVANFPLWTQSDGCVLHQGVPDNARHLLFLGINSFDVVNGETTLVAAVQFIKDGGKPLENYQKVPMLFSQLTKILHSTFDTAARFVFVTSELYVIVADSHSVGEGAM